MSAISAIVLAIHNIEVFCKKLKYRRQIILITNGEGSLDTDDRGEIIEKLQNEKIDLTVLGVDFDDEDFGFKEEDKADTKVCRISHNRDATTDTPSGKMRLSSRHLLKSVVESTLLYRKQFQSLRNRVLKQRDQSPRIEGLFPSVIFEHLMPRLFRSTLNGILGHM